MERLSLRQSLRLSLAAVALVLALVGCAISPAPTAFEKKFFDVETNYAPHILVVTNFVDRTNFVPLVKVVTNTVETPGSGPARIEFVTNFFPVVVHETNTVTVTNQQESYTLTPGSTARAVATAGGVAANLGAPGVGGLVAAGIGGLFSIWAGIRNRQFKSKNTALSQTAGVLTQIVQTSREVINSTPQGERLGAALKAWMINHQIETGTIGQITGIVRDKVDNDEAREAAEEILRLLNDEAQSPKAKA